MRHVKLRAEVDIDAGLSNEARRKLPTLI
jgi:hypothetical protein